MKTKFRFILAVSILFATYSCYPGGAEYIDELDTSISVYSPDYDWTSISGQTYTMPDEIRHIKNGEDLDDPDKPYDEDIINQINDEMQNLGLTLVDGSDPDAVDIVVAITLIEQNNSGSTWVPGGGWWGGWYPVWPGWGWGYYPWYPVYYSYKTGTVLIHMGDFVNRNEDEDTVPPIYEGAIDGLLQGSADYIGARIERGIEELFNQAPFDVN